MKLARCLVAMTLAGAAAVAGAQGRSPLVKESGARID